MRRLISGSSSCARMRREAKKTKRAKRAKFQAFLPFLPFLLFLFPLPALLIALQVGEAQTQTANNTQQYQGWNRRVAGAGDYQIVLEVSGRVEVSRFFKMPDPLDLRSICDAKREAERRAILSSESYLNTLSQAGDRRQFEIQMAQLRNELGQLYAYRGEMAKSIEHFEAAYELIRSIAPSHPEFAGDKASMDEILGVAHMRRGELENCVHNHNAETCIFPLSRAAQHGRAEGSTKAIEYFKKHLAQRPDNLEVRWLLNLAYMTLGKYPQAVPPAYLIPPSAFASKDRIGRFVDVAASLGIDPVGGAGGAIMDDFDNDGRLDVVISTVNACRLDIFVMRGGWEFPMRNSLLRNNGNGTFTDVTQSSGLASGEHRTHTAAWADYDNDGYADLYVSNYGEENFLYRNRGDGTFEEVGKRLGVEKPLMSFPTWFFDYDNDGWLDLFVASFVPSAAEVARGFLGLPPQAETMKLYRNDAKGGFQDVTNEVGLNRVVPTMGANFGDLDNDGFLDIYLGTGAPSYAALMPNFAFRNQAGKRFADVTAATGTGHLQKGHGVAFGDFDNDGDEDIYVNIGGFVPGDYYNKVLFANPGGAHNWISIKLIGAKSNRAAIGAKIKLTLTGANGQKSLRYREVTSGGSFGASSLRQEIGLGRARQIAVMEIWWPASGSRQVFHNVKVNQFIEIDESQSAYRTLPVPVR